MINQNEWTCYVHKCTDKITGKGIPYWLATIRIPKRINGYWGYKKDGVFKPYLEYWNDVNIYTDLPLYPDDKLIISEFCIQKYLKKNNEFDKGEFRVTISVFGFRNETQGYVVESGRHKKRRKSSKYPIISQATNEPIDFDLPELLEEKTNDNNAEEDDIQPFIVE